MISEKQSKRFCKDFTKIENYEKAVNDTTQKWECHHRLETHTSDGERRFVDISRAELVAFDMYLDRPAEELIFLTKVEHRKLHHKGKPKPSHTAWNKGVPCTEEMKQRISKKLTGTHHESRPHSKETKEKISQYNKTHGIKPPSQKGKHWYTNGIINKLCTTCPDGFVPGQVR